MKIGIDCHVLEETRTGSARYLMNLLKYWAEENSEFILYFKNKIPNDIPKNFKNKVLEINSNTLFIHYFLPKAVKKDKVDILFCPAYVAPIFYNGKIALALHDIIYESRPDLYNWPSIFDRILLKWVSKISAKKADLIFACSEFTKKEILKHYKIDSKKVSVIPLAADIKQSSSNIEEIKRKYGIKNKFIFYVGAIINRRFILETIKAFNKIVDKLPDYEFLIAGPNYINLKINQKKVIHINYVDEQDLSALYKNAELFIWLSCYEGFGLPPLEAMTSGTLVITTKTSSLPEVVNDSALFVKNPKDINEISEKIYKGLTDKALKEELIKKGLKQAQKFSWQKTAKQTLKLLYER